jgi:hypothetical protein
MDRRRRVVVMSKFFMGFSLMTSPPAPLLGGEGDGLPGLERLSSKSTKNNFSNSQ